MTLPRRLSQFIVLLVIAAIVGTGAYFLLSSGPTKKVVTHFASAVGIYQNTDVRMMGVRIGRVTSVHPEGATVQINLSYDAKYKVPANAIAVVVANSLVSERYIQLAPAYTGGPVLANGADIPVNRTAAPAELDDIYAALNQLSVALGPTGANKNGALSDLLKVAAANLGGNGTALGQSITNLSQAATTLANGSQDLFGTVANLKTFTAALQSSDAQVRSFNDQLATVAAQLADERNSLSLALSTLTQALQDVSGFIKNNQAIFHEDVSKLVTVSGVLVNQKAALDEVLAVAPLAVANLTHTYNPISGTLDNRTDLRSLTSPQGVCAILEVVPAYASALLQKLTGGQTIGQVCTAVIGAVTGGLGAILKTLGLGGLLPVSGGGGTGLPPIIPVLPGVTK